MVDLVCGAPAPCFTPLSSRLLSSSSDPVSAGPLAAWCPSQDLLALVTADAHLHVMRLNWNKILSLPLPQHKSAGVQAQAQAQAPCHTTALAWRPDGKAMAVACRCGRASLVSIESRSIVAVWRPADAGADEEEGRSEAAAAAAAAPITTLRWVESMAAPTASATAAQRPPPALLQALYLRAQGAAPRGLLRALQAQEASAASAAGDSPFALSSSSSSSSTATGSSSGLALPPSERLPLYFDPLPPLEGALEAFQALALPSGVLPPQTKGSAAAAAAGGGAQRHQSARQQGSSGPASASSAGAGAGTGPPGTLRGILHDALDFASPNFLLLGDAQGRFWVRAFGTLDVLAGRAPPSSAPSHAIIAMDWCGVSATLSLITRSLHSDSNSSPGGAVQLHAVCCPSLVSSSSGVLVVAQQSQQVCWLLVYLEQGLEALTQAWRPARKSFHNRMAGLQDLIDELDQQRKEAAGGPNDNDGEEEQDEEDEEEDKIDAVSELLECLLTGIPSYVVQQFVSRYLSAGPMSKTCEGLAAACAQLLALLTLPLLRAAEQLLFRLQQLRALAATSEDEGGLAQVLGAPVRVGAGQALLLADLQEKAGALWTKLQHTHSIIVQTKNKYEAFAKWIIALVRRT